MHRTCERGPSPQMSPAEQGDGRAADRPGGGSGFSTAMRKPCPHETSSETLLIEPCRVVFIDARRQNLRLPRTGRGFEALELRENGGDGVRPFHSRARSRSLPLEEEAQQIAGSDRLDLGPQAL